MGTTEDLRKGVDEALNDLEQLADEVRVTLHLASMDVTRDWESRMEPRLFAARVHAKEATEASKAAIKDTIQAFRDFSQAM